MAFTLRPATMADCDALHALIELSVRGLQQHDYSAAQMEGALGTVLGLDTQLIADGTYFVATAPPSAELVACGGWSFRRTLFGADRGTGRQDTLLDPAMDAAKVRAIFVHPRWARQGLGTLLLRHAEQAAAARGFQSFEMGSTLTGMPLYIRLGYVPGRTILVPLGNGEQLPVVHMTRRP